MNKRSIFAFFCGMVFCLLFFSLIPVKNGRILNGNNIKPINDYVSNINVGGCGYFAMKLYQRLDSCKYSIVVIGPYNHVAILEKHSGYFIDSDGYRDSLSFQLRYKNKFSIISFDSLKKTVYKENSWNKSFDRKDTSMINDFVEQIW